MKSILALALASLYTLALVFVSLSTLAVASLDTVYKGRRDGCDPNGWVQKKNGCASFTSAHNCDTPSCGVNFTSGFTAAVNELAFGSNHSFGDACGRCFKITPTEDPFSPNFTGPYGQTIVVKVNNLCLDHAMPQPSDPHWCNQTVTHPENQFGVEMHFDLCDLTGAPQAFFPSGRLAMLGTYEEVSCGEWKGSTGHPLWNGSCMANDSTPFWPAKGCGNEGSAPC